MAERQALNATFFAFQKRERGGVLWGASIVYAVLMVVGFGVFGWLNWQAFADYAAWTMTMSQQAAGATDPNNPFGGVMPPSSVMSLMGSYSLFMIVFYLLLASYEAACLRWMIRGETKGFFGLALDGDTLRVYFTYWVWFFLLIAAYFILAIGVFGVIAGTAAGGQATANDPSAMASLGIGVVVAVLAALLLLIFFAVRFAPAAATSIAKRRFAFFDAWTVTKGRFWALLGAFLLLWLMYFVGISIFYSVVVFALGANMWTQMASGAGPATEQEALAMFSSPSVWAPIAVVYVLMIVGGFVFYIALFGINARAAQAALEEGKITAGPA